ncbi:DUF4190 domain-containing protein [Intrasporangium flavum]|uniref:DUF4190 domain-containing protein n=1 Tax=Intrasporangium flavum TaxID=1428657 RepID=UPI001A97BCCE|nr:DUF4190 domain-containing protein [Intrasporangium flavum]
MSPSSPNGEDSNASRSFQLPPPPASDGFGVPAPVAPPSYPPPAAPPYDVGYPAAPTPPPGLDDREHRPGTNGLAIAALCCGIAGFVPFASFVAVALGIVALSQLRRVVQAGRGMAIAGIVLGSLWILGILAFIVFAVASTPDRDASTGALNPDQQVGLSDLVPGDCFDGLPTIDDAQLSEVTSASCDQPHEAQVVASVTLPEGPWPGREDAALRAESMCSTSIRSRVQVADIDRVSLVYVYPSTPSQWRQSRSAMCVLVDPDGGHLTHSVLNPA